MAYIIERLNKVKDQTELLGSLGRATCLLNY